MLSSSSPSITTIPQPRVKNKKKTQTTTDKTKTNKNQTKTPNQPTTTTKQQQTNKPTPKYHHQYLISLTKVFYLVHETFYKYLFGLRTITSPDVVGIHLQALLLECLI